MEWQWKIEDLKNISKLSHDKVVFKTDSFKKKK